VPTSPIAADGFETIVVALDGSSEAGLALTVASLLAERIGVAVDVVHTGRDHPADVIHERVEKFHPALACVASRGRGRSAGVIGSVATDLVARFDLPVLVVGPMVRPELLDPDWRVVACVDERPSATRLVESAVRMSARLRSVPTLLIVAEPVPEPVGSAPARRTIGPDGDVSAYIDHLAQPQRDRGVPIDTAISWDPISPGDGVLAHIRGQNAGLLMVMSHGRTGLKRLALGSAAAGIVHRCPVPVLVIPTTG
jgi:nucleotide-binding universal stress UspA family protein